MLSIFVVLIAVLALLVINAPSSLGKSLPTLSQSDVESAACDSGDLGLAFQMARSLRDKTAGLLHIESALSFILNADVSAALRLHRAAKALDPKTIPPLALFQQAGKTCGGIADLYYVSAVIIKQLIDSSTASSSENLSTQSANFNSTLASALRTMVTLTADSGLHEAAENHWKLAKSMEPNDKHVAFRGALMTPGVYETVKHLKATRATLQDRVLNLQEMSGSIKDLDEYVLSPTFYYVYQGYNDKELLSKLHSAYGNAMETLRKVEITSSQISQGLKKRIGFVSAHFRRHSICKLFCGIISDLHARYSDSLEVYVFSSLQENKEDDFTKTLSSKLNSRFVRIGQTVVRNRIEVTSRNIDILVYLDVGMDPSTVVWAGARLAPIQMCTWGHPSTTGLVHMDYYISSDAYHRRMNPALFAWDIQRDRSNVDGDGVVMDVTGSVISREQVVKVPPAPIWLDDSVHAMTPAQYQANEEIVKHEVRHYPPILSHGMDSYHSLNYSMAIGMNPLSGMYEQDAFSEQLVRLDALGFYFPRPKLQVSIPMLTPAQIDHMRQVFADSLKSTVVPKKLMYLMSVRNEAYYRSVIESVQGFMQQASLKKFTKSFSDIIKLTEQKIEGAKIILIPQHLPKFHPVFDVAIREILQKVPNALLVLLGPENKLQWRRTLDNRWRRMIGVKIMQRFLWMDGLSPEGYLSLLAVGDIMLDPFSFGGGVTTLESLSVCTPVITAPSKQNVPALAAGMIEELGLLNHHRDFVIHSTLASYVNGTVHLLNGKQRTVSDDLIELRFDICKNSEKIFNQSSSTDEWATLLKHVVV